MQVMNKFFKNLLFTVLAVILIIGGIYFFSYVFNKLFFLDNFFYSQEYQPSSGKPYKTVGEKPTGWFTTGQPADLILYANNFNDAGGANNLNHPAKVATDGSRLIVADTYNHRVLIWNKIPTANYQPADLVIGQKNFTDNTPGLTQDKLRWPTGVATDGQRLVVADAYNNRVLIWQIFPTINGQPADVVLGQPDFTTNLEAFPSKITDQAERQRRHIWWPWDVMIYQNKLFVISLDGSLLIYNTFPVQNYASADIILGQPDFSERFKGDLVKSNEKLYMRTPRSVSFDGTYLVIGDYNANKIFIYQGLPAKSGQEADYFLNFNIHKTGTGIVAVAGKIYATMDNTIYVWQEPITQDNQQPDFILGKNVRQVSRYSFNSPYGLATDGHRLIVADTNNSRVLIYDQLPTKGNDVPDIVLGQKDFYTNHLVSRSSRNNPNPVTDGHVLIIGDDYNGLVQVYKNLPDESLAEADVYQAISGWKGTACAYDGQLYCAATERGLAVWEGLSEGSSLPDYFINFSFLNSRNVAVDNKSLYVADYDGNRVFVFSEKPRSNKKTLPDFVLGQPNFESTAEGSGPADLFNPIGVSSDDKHLVVGDWGNKRVLIWNLPIIKNTQEPDLILGSKIGDIGPLRFEGPAGVVAYDDKLFVADNGNNRVLIWSRFPTKATDQPDIVLGQKDFYSKYPSNTQDGLFLPMHLAFDGHYLWVGEFKWSDRLLRFSVK